MPHRRIVFNGTAFMYTTLPLFKESAEFLLSCPKEQYAPGTAVIRFPVLMSSAQVLSFRAIHSP